MKALSSRLRAVREDNGMSQVSLATELCVKPATVSRYENNTSDPDSETILWYAQRFGVSMDYLFGLTDDPTPQSAASSQGDDVIASGEAHSTTDEELAARLPEDVREGVLALMRMQNQSSK